MKTVKTAEVLNTTVNIDSQKMEDQVDQALRPGNADEVLSEAFRLTVTRKDIKTLHQLNWLNDEVC